ncbi:MAG: hypothetical protein R3A80_03215 [Bdellovibrionota bacterium]
MKKLFLFFTIMGAVSFADQLSPKVNSTIVQEDINPMRMGVKYRLFDDDGFEHFDIYGWDSNNKLFRFWEKHHASGVGAMPKISELNRQIIRARLTHSPVRVKMQQEEGRDDKWYWIELQDKDAKELSEIPVPVAKIKTNKMNLKSPHNSYYYYGGFIYIGGIHVRTFHYKDPAHYGAETPDPMALIEEVMEKARKINGSVYIRNINDSKKAPVFELVP